MSAPESSRCPLCRESRAEEVYRFERHRVTRCARCGVMYNPDFPPGESISDTFSDDYYLEHHENAFRDQLEDYRADPSLSAFERGLAEIEALTGGPGTILDVGSAFGSFLRLARDRGWRPTGVEISAYASRISRKTHNLEVFTGDLASADLEDGSFDAVTFWDVIEHVSWPFDDLQRARLLLRPGGVLLLTTDNFDCLISDAGRLLRWASLGRIVWPLERLYIPFNRTYFTERTMLAALESAVLDVSSCRKMEYPLSKIKVSPLQRVVLSGFYVLGAVLRRQAQITVIARKVDGDERL